MNQHRSGNTPSRRTMLRHAAAAGAIVAGAGTLCAEAANITAHVPSTDGALQPVDAIPGILAAMDRFPLVGLADRHQLQEEHDVIGTLLRHPALPTKITDIVVEFGNAAYQDLADRFIVAGQPAANKDLVQVWRQIGDPTWDAPVYEQFFRTVRAVNWALPPARRIRVLLGQPPVTMNQLLAHPTDRSLLTTFTTPMDAHYAAVVEREVLQKGRRALLIAGGGHLRRGLHADSNSSNPLSGPLNAATRLVQRHPGALFVIDTLILRVLADQGGSPAEQRRVAANVAGWRRPAFANLAGTWLGAQAGPTLSYRAVNAAARRYSAQADAVLYLGPDTVLTASRADPAIYQTGAYRDQLRRLSPIVSPHIGPVDLVAYGLQQAGLGPSYFARG